MRKLFVRQPVAVKPDLLTGGSPEIMLQAALKSRDAMRSKIHALNFERARIDGEIANTQICLNAAEAAVAVLEGEPEQMATENMGSDIGYVFKDFTIEDFVLDDKIGEPVPVNADLTAAIADMQVGSMGETVTANIADDFGDRDPKAKAREMNRQQK